LEVYALSNELKMKSVRCSKPSKGGGQKQWPKMWPFCVQRWIFMEESRLQSFFLVWKLLVASCKAFIGLSDRAQTVGGGRPLLSEMLCQIDPPPSKADFDFQSIFARYTSLVIRSEKSSIITGKSSTSFPMSLR